MGGFFYRFHPDDFRTASLYGAYEALADWPYDYDELEPITHDRMGLRHLRLRREQPFEALVPNRIPCRHSTRIR
jgi:choline dehydrogenase-like flavoprotein